ncbi:hypothetical protein NliqN6_2381 [Naganishia liquefaciens]|uniref:Nuclear pore complex protein n=1 Tax=Naganishia liquefaciens TaxID=104408 RepID=A0A8H3TS37_9TREE|nr:hypothetical protein NliqN6_2381 [Naganishia liquefaciens]
MQQAAYCAKFAEVFQAQKSQRNAEDIIDAEHGLAARWRDATLSACNAEENADLQNGLWLQAQTWHLLAVLTEQRLSAGSAGPTAKELLQSNPYTLPERLVQAIIDNDEQLREWIAIKQVLENVNPLRPPTGSASTFRSTYLPDTAKEIERLQRLHGTSEITFAYDTASGTGVALSLDLDSNLREKGIRGAGQWAGRDASRKENVLSAIFDALRRGRYDDAEELCSRSGESWRLATIRGARFWGYYDTEDIAESDAGRLQGNMRRSLWAKSCRAVANNSSASASERAVYGVLSGDLESVLPMCHTWDDHLWAHLNSLIMARIDDKLDQVGGYWHGLFGTSSTSTNFRGDLEQVFEHIEKVQRDGVASQAQDAYARIQQAIISGDEENRIREFVDRIHALQEMDRSQVPTIIGQIYAVLLTSFFAHFILLRRLTEQEIDVDLANAAIQAYLDVLQTEQLDTLVAIYAAELREGTAEDSYASFLRSMGRHASKDDRRVALLRAREHGLNVRLIANSVVRPLLGIVQFKLKSGASYQESRRRTAPGKEDVSEIIRSLEWLVFVDETYPDALNLANICFCWMYNSKNVSAVRRLEESLPQNLIETCQAAHTRFEEESLRDEGSSSGLEDNDAGIEQNIIELRFHVMLRETLDALSEAERQWDAGPVACLPGSLLSEQITWANERAPIIDRAYDAVTQLLQNSGWTSFSPSLFNEARNRGFENVRQSYTGDLVLRLHELLVQSSSHLESNLQRALDFSAIVASEDASIYEKMGQVDVLTNNRPIEQYLRALKDASKEALRLGNPDFWNVSPRA